MISLDGRGCSINDHLGKSKFKFAMKVIAEIYNTITISEHPVYTSYIELGGKNLSGDPEIKCCLEHVQETQYLLLTNGKMKRAVDPTPRSYRLICRVLPQKK